MIGKTETFAIDYIKQIEKKKDLVLALNYFFDTQFDWAWNLFR